MTIFVTTDLRIFPGLLFIQIPSDQILQMSFLIVLLAEPFDDIKIIKPRAASPGA